MTEVGDIVHPRYKGIAEHEVKGIVRLEHLIEYPDPIQGEVSYNPTMVLMESIPNRRKEFWFPYWIKTSATRKEVFGGVGSIYEEDTLLEILKKAIGQGFFTEEFLKSLRSEIESRLKT